MVNIEWESMEWVSMARLPFCCEGHLLRSIVTMIHRSGLQTFLPFSRPSPHSIMTNILVIL